MMNIIILTTKQNGAIIINMTNGIEANAYVPDKVIVLFLFHVWLNLAIVIKHWSLFGVAQKTPCILDLQFYIIHVCDLQLYITLQHTVLLSCINLRLRTSNTAAYSLLNYGMEHYNRLW